jgi:ABC-2 type transport system ATP-binding protein
VRTLKTTLAFLLALAAVALPSPVSAAEPTIEHATVTNPNDGTVIAITVFKPVKAGPARRAPVVLHSHGWGGSRSTSGFGEFMDAGMGVVSIDQRGHGESGGEANVQDPDLEAEDISAVIDYVAKLNWVAHDVDRRGRAIPNDPVLGAIGGSYGGGYQTITALDETAETGRTRFNALAPEITWYDLPHSLAPNKVTRTVWNVALYAVGAANVPTWIHEAFAWGATTGQWPDGTVLGEPVPGVPDLDSVFHEHSPVAFVERGVRINVPVMYRQGISDNLFNLNQGLDIFNKALTPQARKHSYFVGYNGGHVLPNVLPMGTAAGDDACSPKGDFTALTIKFFKRVFSRSSTAGLMPARYNLTTVDGERCLRMNSIGRGVTVPVEGPAGDVIAVSGPGAPLHLEVAQGPITVSGVATLKGVRTALGVDARAFLGLSIGTSPADAVVLTNNLMPMRVALPVQDEAFSLDLTGVSVVVPEGQSLFLTLSPVSDLFVGHGSKVPAGWVLSDLQLRLPAPGK